MFCRNSSPVKIFPHDNIPPFLPPPTSVPIIRKEKGSREKWGRYGPFLVGKGGGEEEEGHIHDLQSPFLHLRLLFPPPLPSPDISAPPP